MCHSNQLHRLCSLTLIQHTSKASEAWGILRSQYETRNQTRIQNLENQLAAEKLSEGEAVETFITRIKNLRDQMAAVGISKTKEDLARRCMRVLTHKFDGLVTALNTQVRNPPLTFEEFSAMLLEEEMRLKSRDAGNGGDSALTAKAKAKGEKKKDGKKKFKGKCHYCGKSGHMAKECRKKEKDEKDGTSRSSSKGKDAVNMSEAELELFIAIEEVCSSAQASKSDDSWVLDSGATRHMTSKKEWLHSLRPLRESINVTVGNNAKCPVEGSGTVSFTTLNGETKKLSEVLYVPQIKRNLISVAAITDRALKVNFDSKGAEIKDKYGKMVGKATRHDNLYELSAHVVVGDSISKLWHERLGHIGFAMIREMQMKGMVAHLPKFGIMHETCEAFVMGKK